VSNMVMAFLMTRLSAGWTAWRERRGESTATGHAGFLIVALILIAAVLVFVLGPGKTWMSSIFTSITSISPPSIPSGA